MLNEWVPTTIGRSFKVNPRRIIKRGEIVPFVPMEVLPVNERAIERFQSREFTGSGTRFMNDDTLIARITPCLENGKTAYVSGLPHGLVGYGSTEFIILAGLEGVSISLFGYYLSRTPDFRQYATSQMEGSSGRQRVPSRAVEDYQILLPPLPEQRAIAQILGTLDDKIELNRKRNETLEAMARALFKDWFVDFGPVRAKMDGRDPYLPAEIWDLFPDRLDEEGKPEGWGYLPFGELLQGTIGGDWGKDNAEDDHEHPVCIIRGTDIPDLASGFTGNVPTRFTTKKKLATRVLEAGDIVIEVSGGSPTQPTGRSLQVTQSILERFPYPVVCASFCRRFRPVNRELGLLASSHLANLYRNGGTWEYQNQSTGISNFQTSHFLVAENVMLPSQGVLKAFVRFVETILATKTNNESITLTQLRDTLLPKLISGEVRVGDVDRFIDRAILGEPL